MGDFWALFKAESSGVDTSWVAFPNATGEDAIRAACFPEERDASWGEDPTLERGAKKAVIGLPLCKGGFFAFLAMARLFVRDNLKLFESPEEGMQVTTQCGGQLLISLRHEFKTIN